MAWGMPQRGGVCGQIGAKVAIVDDRRHTRRLYIRPPYFAGTVGRLGEGSGARGCIGNAVGEQSLILLSDFRVPLL